MKMICYVILIISFFYLFQKDPLFSIFLSSIILGVYYLIKKKKKKGKNVNSNQNEKIEKLILLLLSQQFQNQSFEEIHDKITTKNILSEKEKKLEREKLEILALLEDI